MDKNKSDWCKIKAFNFLNSIDKERAKHWRRGRDLRLFNITHRLAKTRERGRVPQSRFTRITYSKFTCLSPTLSLSQNFLIPSGTCSSSILSISQQGRGRDGVSRKACTHARHPHARTGEAAGISWTWEQQWFVAAHSLTALSLSLSYKIGKREIQFSQNLSLSFSPFGTTTYCLFLGKTWETGKWDGYFYIIFANTFIYFRPNVAGNEGWDWLRPFHDPFRGIRMISSKALFENEIQIRCSRYKTKRFLFNLQWDLNAKLIIARKRRRFRSRLVPNLLLFDFVDVTVCFISPPPVWGEVLERRVAEHGCEPDTCHDTTNHLTT